VAYRAEIEIGVRGQDRLNKLQNQISRLAEQITRVNDQSIFDVVEPKAVQSVQNYSNALSVAAANLREVALGQKEETTAVKQYVDILIDSNAAQKRQNNLINEEIARRNAVTSAIRKQVEANVALSSASREASGFSDKDPVGKSIRRRLRKLAGNPFAYASPIGPVESPLQGQTSPVGERIARIRAYEAAAIDAANNVSKLAEQQEQQITQKELQNDAKVFREKLNKLVELGKIELEINKRNNDQALKDFNTRLANRTSGRFKTDGPLKSPGFKSTQKSIGKMGESLALGAGFPLLFGGGAGSVAGSILGSFVGSGFGGQILGGALGQALDQAVSAAARLANTLETGGDNFSKLREEGIYFTAELEKQVRAVRELGNTAEANRISTAAVAAQTGDIGGLAGRGAGAAVNELEKAWNGVTKAVGTTLGIIAGPFVFALNVVLRGVQGIFLLINAVATGIANLINLIPGAKQLGDALYEKSLEGTAAYENQLAELDKQIKAEYELVELAKVRTGYLEQMLGKSKAEQDILGKQADAAERLKKFEQEIKAFRASAPDGTSELRKKALEQETQMRIKFAENEKQITIKYANELYNAIQENNKRVANTQRGYDEQRLDMVRAAARAQADFDLQATRRLEDARMKMREQELDYVQKVRQEELKTLQLLNRERQLERSITGALSADPEQAEIINTVQTAVENYRAGRMAVEEEARAAQEKAQLEYSKVQVQIERYKYDNAVRINRANEDSQNRIAKINDQIRRQNEEASKQEFKRQGALIAARIKEQMTAANTQYYAAKEALPGALTPADKEYYKEVMATSQRIYYEYENLGKEITATINNLQIAKLQPMAQAPALSDTSGAASAAETAANKQLLVYQQQIQKLQKINGLKQEELQLAQALLAPGMDNLKQFNDLIKQQKDRAAYEREYGDLLRKGIKPALAEQLAVINQMEEAQLRLLDNVIKTVEALNDPAFKDILDRLKEIRQGVTSKAEEARSGAIEQASPRARLEDAIADVKGQLNDLIDPVNLIVGAADAIGTAFADSFKGIISGAMTAQEALASFFQNIADYFLDMAAQIIAKWIQMTILNAALSLFPSGGGAGGAGTTSNGMFGDGAPTETFAGGGIFSGAGPYQFPKKAAGGSVSSGKPYIVGELGPELFVPGKSGTIVPNNKLGMGDANIVVNVDASGTKAEGNAGQANRLGEAIGLAVQQELIKQKRPGGLLA